MRRFYERKRLTRELTQGSIINHCLADNYMEVDNVFGFVITPRCNLAHDAKVTHIHYLPIVNFKDWARHDGEDYLFSKWKQSNAKQFCKICQKHGVPADLDSYFNYEKIANELIKDLSEKSSFLSYAKSVINPLKDDGRFIAFCQDKKNRISMVDNLLKDQLPAFYLIEDWKENHDSFKVILLRELKRFSFTIAKKISVGLDLASIDTKRDDLKCNSQNYDLCQICAQVSSPFVEHIMQRFSHNFCRIGVEDRGVEKEFLLSQF